MKEIPMKQWRSEEASRLGVSEACIQNRLVRNKEKYYPNLRLRRVNQRVVFVQVP